MSRIAHSRPLRASAAVLLIVPACLSCSLNLGGTGSPGEDASPDAAQDDARLDAVTDHSADEADVEGRPDLPADTPGPDPDIADRMDTAESSDLPAPEDLMAEDPASEDPGSIAKRRPVIIDNSANPSDLHNYQVAFTIPFDDNMRPDFCDVRFFDHEEAVELAFWLYAVGI